MREYSSTRYFIDGPLHYELKEFGEAVDAASQDLYIGKPDSLRNFLLNVRNNEPEPGAARELFEEFKGRLEEEGAGKRRDGLKKLWPQVAEKRVEELEVRLRAIEDSVTAGSPLTQLMRELVRAIFLRHFESFDQLEYMNRLAHPLVDAEEEFFRDPSERSSQLFLERASEFLASETYGEFCAGPQFTARHQTAVEELMSKLYAAILVGADS